MTKTALASGLKNISIWSLIASVLVLMVLLIGASDLSNTWFYKGVMIWGLLVMISLLCPILVFCLKRNFKHVLWLSAGALLEIIGALLILMYAYGSDFH